MQAGEENPNLGDMVVVIRETIHLVVTTKEISTILISGEVTLIVNIVTITNEVIDTGMTNMTGHTDLTIDIIRGLTVHGREKTIMIEKSRYHICTNFSCFVHLYDILINARLLSCFRTENVCPCPATDELAREQRLQTELQHHGSIADAQSQAEN